MEDLRVRGADALQAMADDTKIGTSPRTRSRRGPMRTDGRVVRNISAYA
ncbi:hypothetical protein WBG99_08325 [Streptomyces sp. TG1A-60]